MKSFVLLLAIFALTNALPQKRIYSEEVESPPDASDILKKVIKLTQQEFLRTSQENPSKPNLNILKDTSNDINKSSKQSFIVRDKDKGYKVTIRKRSRGRNRNPVKNSDNNKTANLTNEKDSSEYEHVNSGPNVYSHSKKHITHEYSQEHIPSELNNKYAKSWKLSVINNEHRQKPYEYSNEDSKKREAIHTLRSHNNGAEYIPSEHSNEYSVKQLTSVFNDDHLKEHIPSRIRHKFKLSVYNNRYPNAHIYSEYGNDNDKKQIGRESSNEHNVEEENHEYTNVHKPESSYEYFDEQHPIMSVNKDPKVEEPEYIIKEPSDNDTSFEASYEDMPLINESKTKYGDNRTEVCHSLNFLPKVCFFAIDYLDLDVDNRRDFKILKNVYKDYISFVTNRPGSGINIRSFKKYVKIKMIHYVPDDNAEDTVELQNRALHTANNICQTLNIEPDICSFAINKLELDINNFKREDLIKLKNVYRDYIAHIDSNPEDSINNSSFTNYINRKQIKKGEDNGPEDSAEFKIILQKIYQTLNTDPQNIWLLAHTYLGLDINNHEDLGKFINLYKTFLIYVKNNPGIAENLASFVQWLMTIITKDNKPDTPEYLLEVSSKNKYVLNKFKDLYDKFNPDEHTIVKKPIKMHPNQTGPSYDIKLVPKNFANLLGTFEHKPDEHVIKTVQEGQDKDSTNFEIILQTIYQDLNTDRQNIWSLAYNYLGLDINNHDDLEKFIKIYKIFQFYIDNNPGVSENIYSFEKWLVKLSTKYKEQNTPEHLLEVSSKNKHELNKLKDLYDMFNPNEHIIVKEPIKTHPIQTDPSFAIKLVPKNITGPQEITKRNHLVSDANIKPDMLNGLKLLSVEKSNKDSPIYTFMNKGNKLTREDLSKIRLFLDSEMPTEKTLPTSKSKNVKLSPHLALKKINSTSEKLSKDVNHDFTKITEILRNALEVGTKKNNEDTKRISEKGTTTYEDVITDEGHDFTKSTEILQDNRNLKTTLRKISTIIPIISTKEDTTTEKYLIADKIENPLGDKTRQDIVLAKSTTEKGNPEVLINKLTTTPKDLIMDVKYVKHPTKGNKFSKDYEGLENISTVYTKIPTFKDTTTLETVTRQFNKNTPELSGKKETTSYEDLITDEFHDFITSTKIPQYDNKLKTSTEKINTIHPTISTIQDTIKHKDFVTSENKYPVGGENQQDTGRAKITTDILGPEIPVYKVTTIFSNFVTVKTNDLDNDDVFSHDDDYVDEIPQKGKLIKIDKKKLSTKIYKLASKKGKTSSKDLVTDKNHDLAKGAIIPQLNQENETKNINNPQASPEIRKNKVTNTINNLITTESNYIDHYSIIPLDDTSLGRDSTIKFNEKKPEFTAKEETTKLITGENHNNGYTTEILVNNIKQATILGKSTILPTISTKQDTTIHKHLLTKIENKIQQDSGRHKITTDLLGPELPVNKVTTTFSNFVTVKTNDLDNDDVFSHDDDYVDEIPQKGKLIKSVTQKINNKNNKHATKKITTSSKDLVTDKNHNLTNHLAKAKGAKIAQPNRENKTKNINNPQSGPEIRENKVTNTINNLITARSYDIDDYSITPQDDTSLGIWYYLSTIKFKEKKPGFSTKKETTELITGENHNYEKTTEIPLDDRKQEKSSGKSTILPTISTKQDTITHKDFVTSENKYDKNYRITEEYDKINPNLLIKPLKTITKPKKYEKPRTDALQRETSERITIVTPHEDFLTNGNHNTAKTAATPQDSLHNPKPKTITKKDEENKITELLLKILHLLISHTSDSENNNNLPKFLTTTENPEVRSNKDDVSIGKSTTKNYLKSIMFFFDLDKTDTVKPDSVHKEGILNDKLHKPTLDYTTPPRKINVNPNLLPKIDGNDKKSHKITFIEELYTKRPSKHERRKEEDENEYLKVKPKEKPRVATTSTQSPHTETLKEEKAIYPLHPYLPIMIGKTNALLPKGNRHKIKLLLHLMEMNNELIYLIENEIKQLQEDELKPNQYYKITRPSKKTRINVQPKMVPIEDFIRLLKPNSKSIIEKQRIKIPKLRSKDPNHKNNIILFALHPMLDNNIEYDDDLTDTNTDQIHFIGRTYSNDDENFKDHSFMPSLALKDKNFKGTPWYKLVKQLDMFYEKSDPIDINQLLSQHIDSDDDNISPESILNIPKPDIVYILQELANDILSDTLLRVFDYMFNAGLPYRKIMSIMDRIIFEMVTQVNIGASKCAISDLYMFKDLLKLKVLHYAIEPLDKLLKR